LNGLFVAILAAGAVAAVPGCVAADGPTGTIQIGGLLSLSGSSSSSGVQMDAAVRLAVDDFNSYLNRSGALWSIEWVLEDIQTDPDTALDAIQSMNSRSIGMVIGPDTSASLERIMDYVNDNGMLLVSPSSTAPSLAIPGDAVFRLAPNDAVQGRALGKLLESDGVRVLVPFWRDDSYGNGLRDATAEDFEDRGGVVQTGVRYDPTTPEHSLEVRLLNKYVTEASDMYGADGVAVLVIGFDEVDAIIRTAAQYDQLASVRWYGDGSAAQSGALLDDEASAGFLTGVEFRTVQPFVSNGELGAYVRNALAADFGEDISPYIYPAYDAVWIIGKAIEAAGGADTPAIQTALPGVAGQYTGALSSARLDGAGDLDSANYDVRSPDGGFWESESKYLGEHDLLVPARQLAGEVEVGVLLPIDNGPRGATLAATRLGAEDFNAFLDGIGIDWRMALVAEDPRADPVRALALAEEMHQRGIGIILGPGTSASAKAVKLYADTYGMTMLSCCSTAPSLAIANDSLFRLVPDDSQQGVALGGLLESEGAGALVPIWVADPYGDELHRTVSANFAASRGGMVGDGIRYGLGQTEFSAEASRLASEVEALVDEHGADRVAVLMISHAESTNIARAASSYDVLSSVRWFGSETVVGRAELAEGGLGEWAEGVGLTAIQTTEDPGRLHGRVQAHISEMFGQAVSAYAYPSYDAAWLAGLSILRAGTIDATEIRSVLGEVAAGYRGAIGDIVLNEAGDLASADYAVWRATGDGWVEIGRYSLADDTVTVYAQP